MQKIRVVLGLALLFCFSLSLNGNCQMVDVDTSKAANFNGRYRLSASDGRLYIRAKTGVKVGVANLTDISTVQVDNLSDDYIPYWDGLVWRNTPIIATDGKVGIGTASPAYKLEVNGTLGTGTITQTGTGTYGSYNSTGSGNAYAQYKYNGSTIGYIGQGSGIASPGSDTDFGIRADNDLIFTSGTYHERMRIDSDGNVGIGTPSPSDELHVNGTARATKILVNTGTDSGEELIVNGTAKISGDVEFGAKVGIGTASPAASAHISDSGGDLSGTVTYSTNTEGLVISNTGGTGYGTGYGSGLWFRNNGIPAGIASTRVNGSNWATDLRFYTHQTATTDQNILLERMRITEEGNVGIGTESPQGRLHISNIYESAVPSLGSPSAFLNLTLANAWGLIAGTLNSGNSYIQSQRVDATATAYNLLLQPSGGNVGIGTTGPTESLDVDSDAIRIRTASTPASATAAGAVGEIRWDASYMYICTATNTWKRSAIATW